MNLARHSADVFLARGPIAPIGHEEIAFLKAAVAASPKGRVRINLHPDGDDRLHEMFIAIRPESYIRPHKHLGKSEAFHLVYGAVDVIVFEDDGEIREIVRLAAADPELPFYYRMSGPLFHTLIIRSDVLVVHEITNGPFRPEETLFASFAPEDRDGAAVEAYEAALGGRVAALQPA
jgi:cupin fold WbuC family metalloprotein